MPKSLTEVTQITIPFYFLEPTAIPFPPEAITQVVPGQCSDVVATAIPFPSGVMPQVENKCTCSMVDLMTHGCKCGQMDREKNAKLIR